MGFKISENTKETDKYGFYDGANHYRYRLFDNFGVT